MEQGTHEIKTLTDRQAMLLKDLSSWATLQRHITTIDSEEEAQWLMRAEQAGKNRIRILERLLSRYNRLRLERERRELAFGKLPF
jgi:hypothetical protein